MEDLELPICCEINIMAADDQATHGERASATIVLYPILNKLSVSRIGHHRHRIADVRRPLFVIVSSFLGLINLSMTNQHYYNVFSLLPAYGFMQNPYRGSLCRTWPGIHLFQPTTSWHHNYLSRPWESFWHRIAHYSDVTWAPCCLKSPTDRRFIQQLPRANMNEWNKSPSHWPFLGESGKWFYTTKDQ